MHTSRFQLPDGYSVRYDFHEHPRGISAIVINTEHRPVSVGFAKFNPNDAQFSVKTGRSIARGRALSKLSRDLTRPRQVGRGAARMRAITEAQQARRHYSNAELAQIGASIADELVMVPTV